MKMNAKNSFSFSQAKGGMKIWLGAGEKHEVKYAIEDLIGDVQKIIGVTLPLVGEAPACNAILVQTCPDEFGGAWENYRVDSLPHNVLRICGSDSRGTMFGIYAFLRDYLKVDPFYHWTQKEPEQKDHLEWNNVSILAGTPSFKFRGWFVNDEDLLTGWVQGGIRKIRHPLFHFSSWTIHLDVIRKIVETALRAGFNLMIPSSYACIFDCDEKMILDEVAKRGLFLTTHHCETMGVSSFSFENYWKQRGETKGYSYLRERDAMITVWREAITRWKHYPNVVWQLGLRIGGDAPMQETGRTMTEEEQGALLSAALSDQYSLLSEELGQAPEYATMTLWAEGSYLYEKGYLKIPPKVIIVFSDNCVGYKMQPDFYNMVRDSRYRYGIYYHQDIIWGTHLTPCVSPERTQQVLSEAHARRSSEYLIVNVGCIREFCYGLSATSEIARDVVGCVPDEHLDRWIATYFSSHHAEFKKLYQRYYSAFELHPERKVPMFMDNLIWSTGIYYIHKLGEMEYDEPLLLAHKRRTDPFGKSQHDMYPQIEDHDLYRKAMIRQNRRMAGIYRQGLKIMDELPDAERARLFNFLVYYAGVLTCTGKWMHKLGGAFAPASTGDYVGAVHCLEASKKELLTFFFLARHYCCGAFKDWYKHTESVDFREALARHVTLIGQYRELAAESKVNP